MKKVALIMAGGVGLKLWPTSSEKLPKQFNYLMGDGTLIQNTYSRLSKYFDPTEIYIITSNKYCELIEEQLPEVAPENVIYEPFGRNTAPCINLAAEFLLFKGYSQKTVVYVFPSDHLVSNIGEFYENLDTAYEAASSTNGIVTIGIQPSRPESQFGYIQVIRESNNLGDLYKKGLRKCSTFAEKPDIGTAKRFIESGDFLWNSGIFIWTLEVILESFKKHLPTNFEQFQTISKFFVNDRFGDEIQYIYKQIIPISLDYGILEKADNVYCIETSMGWSDLSNWDELYRLSLKDANNNVVQGNSISINNHNSLIVSKNKLIGVVGLNDVIVIENDHSILICKRGEAEKVQELIDYMRRKHIHQYL
jgi:mannose-1-phosphate guanylyltransferase